MLIIWVGTAEKGFEVRGQGHSQAKCTYAAEGCPQTYDRLSIIRAAEIDS